MNKTDHQQQRNGGRESILKPGRGPKEEQLNAWTDEDNDSNYNLERYRRPITEQENGKIGYGSEKRIIMKEILATAGKNEKQICFQSVF